MRQPKQPQLPPVNISSREIVTRSQIEALLGIVSLNMASLGHYLRVESDEPIPSTKPRDSEAKIALENTVVAACARLDGLINDDSRWDMAFQTKVEQAFADAQTMQRDVLAAQKRAADEFASPHFLLRPALLRLKDESMPWCAFLGDLNHMDLGIVGVGRTPEEAVAAFDDNFRGVTNPRILDWCKTREKNLETNAPDAPFPITEQNEKRQTVEQEGTGNPEQTSGGGEDRPADSGLAGPNA